MHVEGLALGGGLVALVAVLVLTVPEAPTTTRSDTPLLPGVLLALRNRPNLLLLPVWLLANVAVYTAMAVLPFWVQYVLRPPDGQRELWFLAVCGATYGAALVAIPFWSYVAEHPRSSKKQATLVSWACSLVIAGLLLPLGEGQFVAAVVLCFLLGATMAGWNFLFFALQADVVDYDELHTGVRREAQCAAARPPPPRAHRPPASPHAHRRPTTCRYAALAVLLPKLVAIVADALPMALLAAAGYVPNKQPQPAGALWMIKALLSLTPLFFGVACLGFLAVFPITREAHHAIMEGIRKHRRGEPATDPLTGAEIAPPRQAVNDAMSARPGRDLSHFWRHELRAVQRRLDAAASAVGGGDGGGWARLLLVRLVSFAAHLAVLGGAVTACALTDAALAPRRMVGELLGVSVSLVLVLYGALKLQAAVALWRRPPEAEAVAVYLEYMPKM